MGGSRSSRKHVPRFLVGGRIAATQSHRNEAVPSSQSHPAGSILAACMAGQGLAIYCLALTENGPEKPQSCKAVTILGERSELFDSPKLLYCGRQSLFLT